MQTQTDPLIQMGYSQVFTTRVRWHAGAGKLMFENLPFDDPNSKAGEACGLQEGVRAAVVRWSLQHGSRLLFHLRGDACGLKAYTLAIDALRPEQLPLIDEGNVHRIVKQPSQS